MSVAAVDHSRRENVSKTLPVPEEDNPEVAQAAKQNQMDELARVQLAFESILRRRRCVAQTSSSCFCPCTYLGTSVCAIVCAPVLIYGVCCEDRNYLEEGLKLIGCTVFDRGPQNKREYCCMHCMPYCKDDFPKELSHYSFPNEKEKQRERREEMHNLRQEIAALKEINLSNFMRTTSHKTTQSSFEVSSRAQESLMIPGSVIPTRESMA